MMDVICWTGPTVAENLAFDETLARSAWATDRHLHSLVTPAPDHLNLKAGFRQGTDVVCSMLAAFGVDGKPQGTSDVPVGDRKISGNAQSRRCKALLVHGTLLVDFDFDLAEKVLRHPLREPAYRRGRSHRDFLVTLRALGVRADRKSINKAAMGAARQVFGRVNALCDLDIRMERQSTCDSICASRVTLVNSSRSM